MLLLNAHTADPMLGLFVFSYVLWNQRKLAQTYLLQNAIEVFCRGLSGTRSLLHVVFHMSVRFGSLPRKRCLVRLPLLQGRSMRISLEVYTFTYRPVNIRVDERHIAMVVQGILNRLVTFLTKASKEPALSEPI